MIWMLVKTITIDLKKLNDVVNKKVIKNKKFNTLNTKGNKLDKKIPNVTTLIHINQYNTEYNTNKHSSEEKI